MTILRKTCVDIYIPLAGTGRWLYPLWSAAVKSSSSGWLQTSTCLAPDVRLLGQHGVDDDADDGPGQPPLPLAPLPPRPQPPEQLPPAYLTDAGRPPNDDSSSSSSTTTSRRWRTATCTPDMRPTPASSSSDSIPQPPPPSHLRPDISADRRQTMASSFRRIRYSALVISPPSLCSTALSTYTHTPHARTHTPHSLVKNIAGPTWKCPKADMILRVYSRRPTGRHLKPFTAVQSLHNI